MGGPLILMYDFLFFFVAKEFNDALCCIIPSSFASADSKSTMDFCLIQDLIYPTFRTIICQEGTL